jgi:hypothetical protein
MMMVAYVVICWHFAGRQIPRKLAWLALLAILVTAFVFYPLMSMSRLVITGLLSNPNRGLVSVIEYTATTAANSTACGEGP